MTTMNISLPDVMKEFIDEQVQERGYSTSSEYIRDLIRNDEVRQGEQRLAALLREGLESGSPVQIDATHWAAKKEALKERFARQ